MARTHADPPIFAVRLRGSWQVLAEWDADLGGEEWAQWAAVTLLDQHDGAWLLELVSPDEEAVRRAVQWFQSRIDAIGSSAVELTRETLGPRDWIAESQRHLAPQVAGRFLVHGSHDRSRVGGRQFAIEIEAGQAFGTAHHPTTTGCLLAIDRLARQRACTRVLDLGTGSGILAIATARAMPAARILATDIDPVAIRVASDNVRLNRCHHRITTLTAPGLTHPTIRSRAPYDLILANILAGPLVEMARGIAALAEAGGVVVLSGILTDQAGTVRAAMRSANLVLRCDRRIDQWSTLTLVRQ